MERRYRTRTWAPHVGGRSTVCDRHDDVQYRIDWRVDDQDLFREPGPSDLRNSGRADAKTPKRDFRTIRERGPVPNPYAKVFFGTALNLMAFTADRRAWMDLLLKCTLTQIRTPL